MFVNCIFIVKAFAFAIGRVNLKIQEDKTDSRNPQKIIDHWEIY